MMKKTYGIVLSIIVISVLLCTGSFAQDIEIHPALTLNQEMSDQALDLAKDQFEQLKVQLITLQNDPQLPQDQKEMIGQAIVIVEDKLNRLDRIEVYFANENSSGAAFQELYNFYRARLTNWRDASHDELKNAVTQIPPGIVIPEATLQSLDALLQQEDKVKAATGTSGKSRLSLTTVYINPDTLEVIEGTTVVIAIDR